MATDIENLKRYRKKYYEDNKSEINKKTLLNYYKKRDGIKFTVLDGFKICSKCKEILPVEKFGKCSKSKDGYKPSCKECRCIEYKQDKDRLIEKQRKWYLNNKDKAKKTSKVYRKENIEWYQSYNKKYYEENSERMKENSKKSLYRRIEEDDGFKILQRLKKRMYDAVKGTVKSARSIELIGCSTEKLKEHLEKQFTNGMTWDNYGEWHVDHILPCASFDFTKESDQRECFNYKNLQPLWAIDNIRKSDKMPGDF